MIIYNVTVNIDEDVHEEWLEWMKTIHIPDVMNTGHFIESKLSRILAEEEGGKSYSIQYLCESMEVFERYQSQHAIGLQEAHSSKYRGKFVAFRTMLRVDKSFTYER